MQNFGIVLKIELQFAFKGEFRENAENCKNDEIQPNMMLMANFTNKLKDEIALNKYST